MPKVIDTPKLNELLAAARKPRSGCNRIGSEIDESPRKVDPDGKHVLSDRMLHNDTTVRCVVMVKMAGTMEPVLAWLDVPLGVFNEIPDHEVGI